MALVCGGCLAVMSVGGFCHSQAACDFIASKLTYTHPDKTTTEVVGLLLLLFFMLLGT